MTRTKAGRPRRAKRLSNSVVTVRVTSDERQQWERESSRFGMSLSDWVRRWCRHGATIGGTCWQEAMR